MTTYELDGRKMTVTETSKSGEAAAVVVFGKSDIPDSEDIEKIAETISDRHNLSKKAEPTVQP